MILRIFTLLKNPITEVSSFYSLKCEILDIFRDFLIIYVRLIFLFSRVAV